MGEKRKIENEREARRCLAAVARSGARIGEWARARGIDGRSLRAWHLNLSRCGGRVPGNARRSSVVAPIHGLVELVARAPESSQARYAVCVGDAKVEFGDDFNDDTLRRVLALVRAC
jgi:hypothetical protein